MTALFQRLLLSSVTILAFTHSSFGLLVDFSDLTLSSESYHNNSAFSSDGAAFNNSYDSTYGSWGGFAYSNVTNNTTAGYLNQYSAITGGGSGSSSIYGVAYVDTYTATYPQITLPSGFDQPISLSLTNTTYAYFAMKDGDGFANQFVQDDYFYLTISAYAANGTTLLGSVDFYLADFRSLNSADHYILDEWTDVDVSSFGGGVKFLRFNLTSSDSGAFGINTPTYFAVGSVLVVPEPSGASLILMATGIYFAIRIRRRLAI